MKQPIKQIYVNNYKDIFINICFPLIVSPNSELIKLKNEGSSYKNYILDILSDQKFKTIKCVASYFLQTLCEEMTGFDIYVQSFCLQLLNYCIKGGDPSIFTNNYNNDNYQMNLLNEYNSTLIIQKLDSVAQIETALFMLCLISDSIIKNELLKNCVLQFYSDNFNALMQTNNDLINYKVCLLIAEFLNHLYEPMNNIFLESCNFLFKHLLNYKENESLSYIVHIYNNKCFLGRKLTKYHCFKQKKLTSFDSFN